MTTQVIGFLEPYRHFRAPNIYGTEPETFMIID
jgi:hypothetical protein